MTESDRLSEAFRTGSLRIADKYDAMAEWADDEDPKRFRTESGRLAEIEQRAEKLREVCRE